MAMNPPAPFDRGRFIGVLATGSIVGAIWFAVVGLFKWEPPGSGAVPFTMWVFGLLNLANWAGGRKVVPGSPMRSDGHPIVFYPGRFAAGVLTTLAVALSLGLWLESVTTPYAAHLGAAGLSLAGGVVAGVLSKETVRE